MMRFFSSEKAIFVWTNGDRYYFAVPNLLNVFIHACNEEELYGIMRKFVKDLRFSLFSLNGRQSQGRRFFFSYPVIAAPSSRLPSFFVRHARPRPCCSRGRVLLQWPLTLLSSFLRPRPTLPVTTTHRTLTTTWFLCPNLRLQRLAFPLSSCSFGSVPGSVLLVLVFAFVLLVYFCHLSTRLQFSRVSLCFHVCVTT